VEENAALKRNVAYAYIILSIGALMLLFGSLYIVYKLSLFYGIGIGAATQSLAYNKSVTSSVAALVLSNSDIGGGILESFVAFVVALAMGAASFILLLSRRDLPSKSTSRYTFMGAILSIVYILLFFLASSSIPLGYNSTYEMVPYFGFILCIGSISYIEYVIRAKQHRIPARGRTAMALNPAKPFSNMMSLQEQLFSKMVGHIRVIDKHFNSTALQNFYRLIEKDTGNFTKITILTSREMLGGSFSQEINDFRTELTGAGIELDVRLMDQNDTVVQHERILMDDKVAYKVPPFNIIHTRSEHITKINFKEADKRFSDLMNRAIKLENWQVEKGRK
jgi:hypothetical protein